MIRVRTIGSAEVEIGRNRITLSTEVVLALAVYLAVRAGERVTRDEVVELFWPDADAVRGRHNLRQMLYRLRKVGFRLDEEGEELRLDRGRVDCDVAWLQRGDALPPASIPIDQFTSDFLPGVGRGLSRAAQGWIDEMRTRLALHLRVAALAAIESSRREARWAEMSRWSSIVLLRDPLNEEATLAKAEAAAMLGSKAQAIGILDDYVDELGPAASRIGLPAVVLRKRISERNGSWGHPASRELKLIGREALLARLSRHLEQASSGQGAALLLVGPAGVGKSRLTIEMRAVAEIRGFRYVELRIDASAKARPFASAVSLAQRIAGLPGAAGCPPEAMALLRRVGDRHASSSAPHAPFGGDLKTGQLRWAIAECLEAVCVEQKLLVVLEDLHNIDEPSWETLCGLAPIASASRLLLHGTSRTIPHGPVEGPPGASAWMRMSVAPLPLDQTKHLVRLLASSSGTPLTDTTVSEIAASSGGNPLFVRELTTAAIAHSPTGALPASLQQLIDDRLAQLAPPSSLALRLITLLGPLATVARVRQLGAFGPVVLASVLESLEQEGIISLSKEGVLATHECWRGSVEQSLSPATRAALSLECAIVLEEDPDAGEDDPTLWRRAELHSAGGQALVAQRLYLRLGESLLSRGLASQAVTAFRRAVTDSTSPLSWSIKERLTRALLQSGALRETIAVAREELGALPTSHADEPTIRTLLLSTLVDALFRDGRCGSEEVRQLAELAEHSAVSDEAKQTAALVGMRVTYIAADSPVAQRFAMLAREASSRSGATLPGLLALLIYAAERGVPEEVDALSEQIGQLSGGLPASRAVSQSLRYRAVAHRFAGSIETAFALASEALRVALASGAIEEAEHSAMLTAFMALDECDLSTASDSLVQWRSWRKQDLMATQEHEIAHAEARLALQDGRPDACLSRFQDFLHRVRSDQTPRRQASESGCVALAAALTGHGALAQEMISLAIATIRSDTPSSQLDSATEWVARALRALGRPEESDAIAVAYLVRRKSEYDRRIPPAFETLIETRAILDADASGRVQLRDREPAFAIRAT